MKKQEQSVSRQKGVTTLLLVLFLLSAITNCLSQSTNSYWKFLNPGPVGVHINDIEYTNDRVGYAVCENGVIARTTDAGRSWTFDQLPAKDFLTAIDFTDELTGYITAYGGKVFKTTNRGINWTQLTTPTTANLNHLWFINSNTGYIVGDAAGGSATIYRTTDGGTTWTSLAAGFPYQNRNIRAISFYDASVGYASGSSGLVARTQDGGVTWTNISLTTTNPAPVNGTNFISQNYPGLGVVDAQNVVISSQNNTYVIKTSDGGATWTIKIAQSGAPLNLTSNIQMLNIAVKDSRVAIAMGAALVGISSDKGNTWSVSRVFPSTSVNAGLQFAAVTFTPDNGVKLAGLYGVMADSASGSSRWDTTYYKNVNYSPTVQKTLTAVSHLDNNKLIATGANGHIYRSNDGGASWVNRSIPEFSPPIWTPVSIYDVKYVAADATYIACSNGYVYRSLDAGDNWPNPYAFNTGRTNWGLDFLDTNTGWVCGSNNIVGSGAVFRTTNGGSGWTMQSSAFTGVSALLGIDFINDNTGWVVGGPAGKIFKSTDGGINWAAQTAPATVTGNLSTVAAVNADTIYAAGAGGKVIRTVNGGATWTDISPAGFTGVYNKILFANSKSGMVIGNSGTCFKTTDAGNTWINFSPPTGDALYALSIIRPYGSTASVPAATNVDMVIVGGRIIGALAPTIFQARVFDYSAVPAAPVIVNVSEKCASSVPGRGKIMNPPPYTQVDITVDGVPVLYYPNDSSFVYYEPGLTSGGPHTVRVRYTNTGGTVFSETSFIFYAVNEVPLVSISSNDADNIICNGQSVTYTANPVFGGATPTYRWMVNRTPVGSGGNSYTYTPVLGDVVSVVMTSSFSCVTNPYVETFTNPADIPQFNPVIKASSANLLTVLSPDINGAYQWYKDGQPIPGATGTTYTATLFGNYHVQEVYRTCIKQSNVLAVGSAAGDVQVFPVPASTILYARSGSASALISRVIIFDASGRQVMTKLFSNSNLVEIDISRLTSGVYTAKFEAGTQLVTKKFIVQ